MKTKKETEIRKSISKSQRKEYGYGKLNKLEGNVVTMPIFINLIYFKISRMRYGYGKLNKLRMF